MAEKPRDEKPKRASGDYSQRARDVVREVEKRHAERHKDESDAAPERFTITVGTNMDHVEALPGDIDFVVLRHDPPEAADEDPD